jgi:hypothetical protein
MKQARALYKTMGKQLPDPLIPNQNRLEYELKILDIWASAYIQMVSDTETYSGPQISDQAIS